MTPAFHASGDGPGALPWNRCDSEAWVPSPERDLGPWTGRSGGARVDASSEEHAVAEDSTHSTVAADRVIQSTILERLDVDPAVTAAEIGVLVRAAAVTLYGVLDTIAERRAAVGAATAVHGVASVTDELLVFLSKSGARAGVLRAVVARTLERAPEVLAEAIRIVARRDGTVVLTGTVPAAAMLAASSRVVEQVRNVRVVENRLGVLALPPAAA